MKSVKRKILSVLLAAAMTVSLLPVQVFAAGETANSDAISGLTSGDTVAIYNDGNAKAMTATASGSKLAGADAALDSDGRLTGDGIALFTVTVDDDGCVTFVIDGKYLTSGETGGSLTLADKPSDYSRWAIEDGGDGLFFVKSVNAVFKGSAQYLEYYNSFTTYGKKDGADSKPYAMSFRQLADAGEPEPAPAGPVLLDKLTEAPADGSNLVIYHPDSKTAMSTAPSGNKLSGIAAEPENGKLAQADGMALLSVSVDDGAYTFTADGKYLTSGDSGNSLSFADALTDCGKWTLEQQEDGTWYILNVGAEFKGSHNQALEYYSGFTTYGRKDNNAAYRFEFYGTAPAAKTGLVTDLNDLTDGSRVVILNPAHNKALSQTMTGNYSAGVDVAIADGELAGYGESEVFTVSINNSSDGAKTYSFADAQGNKLGMQEQYASTSMGAVNDQWYVTPAQKDATFYLQNTVRSTYLEWYASKGNWSTYKANNDEALFAQQFYLVPAPGETPDEPAGNTYGLVSKLSDGDSVILYNAASGAGLGNSLASYKVEGVPLTPKDGVITTDSTAVVWTVGVNKDGTYTFTQGSSTLGGTVSEKNGKTYNNIALTGAAYTSWTLSGPDSSDFNYFLSLDEIASSYGKIYLEYYNGFTLYGSSSPDKGAYGITFYKKGADAETPGGGEEPADDGISVGTLVTDLSQLTDGQTVLIYSPGHKTAASSVPNGDWYLQADPVTDSFTKDLIWTVGVSNGTYTFSNGTDRVLSAWLSENNGKTYVELTVNPKYNDETATGWNLDVCNANNHTWYVSSSTLKVNDNNCYIEAYTRNGGEVFSGYSTAKLNENEFGLQFYIVDPKDAGAPADDGTWDGVLTDKAAYAVYNASAQAVLGLPNDMGNALTSTAATIENGKASVSNGALVFTAGSTGRYYTFETGGKYLATNAAEDLFLQDEIDDYAKWYLTENGDGYLIYSKAAKYNGSPVCIEFFSGSFSGWTFKSSDADIFRFSFYPVTDGTHVIDGVAQVPAVRFDCEDSRYVEQDYAASFTLDDLAESVSEIRITYTVGDKTGTISDPAVDGKTYSFTIPASELDGAGAGAFTITVDVTNSSKISYQGSKTVSIVDEPFFGTLTPAANAQTGEDKRPAISAVIGNAGEQPAFTMTVNGQAVEAVYENGTLRYTPAADLDDGRVSVKVTVTRADGKAAEKAWSFYVGKAQMQLYFGQLHSHTTYSDGSGTLESALEYISKLPESANVQFVAFTDHSNYFDTTSAANPEGALYDMSLAPSSSQDTWNRYKQTVADFNAAQSDLIAIAGFEMTWSGGPGHINTFNTPGIVSRNNKTLNNKTGDAGMKAYYALLDQEEGKDSISQFNHPGKTFGNFTDFSYWDGVTDSRIYTVEVGNGEGQIGAGGYYPSYEQYIMALDKGWHVAPTNNQDNHKGRWGNANDARDVILTDDFSEQGIYDAIRAMRLYATEDKNLELRYTVNGEPLGTIFTEVPEKLNVEVTLYDPDAGDSISKVELVANSGAVAYTWDNAAELSSGLLNAQLDPTYTYYFVRVTQADGDLAVTAPVWVGESLKLGISSVESSVSTPVTGEELTLTTTFYNSESKDAAIKSIVYTTNGSTVIGTDPAAGSIPANGTRNAAFKYTPDKAKIMTITVTAVVELDGVEYTFTKDITLEVKDADKLVYFGIDASHYNEYVAGNYKDSMGNFGALAAQYGVRTVELKTSEELIAACGNEKFLGISLTAPSRRDGTALRDPYATYSDAELEALKAFNGKGGMIIVTGWGDYYESYSAFPAEDHMAAQQNKLLEALGSSIRIGDDEVVDDALNGGQSMRLYFSSYNFDSPLLEGVILDEEHPNDRNYTEVYSNYGGASVYFTGEGVPSTVTPVVFGHESTYTVDSDSDGVLNTLKYACADGERVVVLATEELEGKGLIVVSGAAFMSNFEVQAAASSGSADADTQKNYSNYKICENLVKGMNSVELTSIADVRAEKEDGIVFTIEGVVTSNASGYDKDTAFFDCIYVQDETAGLCCFPVAGNFKVGDRVRITGYTDSYQGEPELQVQSISVVGEGETAPTEVTAAQISGREAEGLLVTLKGTVESFEYANDLVQTIMVRDSKGDTARVFIDGYITTGHEVQNLEKGCSITVTGLASYDDTFNAPDGPFPRIRIRDRADVVCEPDVNQTPDEPAVPEPKARLFDDVAEDHWADEAITFVAERKVMIGIGDRLFAPELTVTRGTMAQMLFNLEGASAPAGEDAFPDIEGKWYQDAANWAASAGIMKGTDAGFAGDDPASREQIAAILYRYAQYKGYDTSASASLSAFADGEATSSWAYDEMCWAVGAKLINGTDKGLEPQSIATRAQLASLMMRFIQLIEKA